MEFIISPFIEGSTCFERHIAHHQELDYGVCKPEPANTVRAPDDERYAARNMLGLQ